MNPTLQIEFDFETWQPTAIKPINCTAEEAAKLKEFATKMLAALEDADK